MRLFPKIPLTTRAEEYRGRRRGLWQPANPFAGVAARFTSLHWKSGGPRSISPLFAAISLPSAPSTPQPLYDLALTPKQMAPALEGVPLWTVVNQSNRFILTSEKGNPEQQLALFYFNEEDAQGLLKQINKRDKKLGARVTPVSLDKVYELALADSGEEGLVVRLVPDQDEVEAAFQLSSDRGHPLQAFDGVPVFQAQGLTITHPNEKGKSYVPLFLSKQDVEMALRMGDVEKQREAAAAEGMASAEHMGVVELSSLEEVLRTLQESEEGSQWSNVVLIPSAASRKMLQEKLVAGGKR